MTSAAEPIRLDSRLELMLDDYLLDSVRGMKLVLHEPTKREVAIVHDAPWEGNNCGFHTVLQDGDLYRMYYMIAHNDCGEAERRKEPAVHEIMAGYAESKDGIHWVKPELGQFEFAGSKKNNILMWDGYDKKTECFLVPFKDPNPNCKPDEAYKAMFRVVAGLCPAKSADGVHWSAMADHAVITKGAFDSENLAFYDVVRGEYRAYFRDIRTSTSQDFIHWTEPVWIEYPDSPPQQLYTNQIAPYYRAPHLFIGFPTRYVERLVWNESFDTMAEVEHRKQRFQHAPRYGAAVTDGLFMSSRDGLNFKRWGEAFLRPGPQELGHWLYGDQYQNWGLVETKSDLPGAPNELSFYSVENCWRGIADQMRRYTIRIDGFVSLQAALSGGEFTTKPILFSGKNLVLNFATSAAGSLQVELQDADGKPIEGFTLADCPEIFGDAIARTVAWKGNADVSSLAGKPIRLHIVAKDGDLYSFQFK
jgi:hypothetical protein